MFTNDKVQENLLRLCYVTRVEDKLNIGLAPDIDLICYHLLLQYDL